jgi:hypothetical protein
VDARSAPGDLAEQLGEVPGGRVDAVAVQNLWSTDRPGGLLDLDAPVAWADGLPATGVMWACVLDEAATRLSERATGRAEASGG